MSIVASQPHFRGRALASTFEGRDIPTLSYGRFLQPDPIGYEDQTNLYAYSRNDPINGRDPTGLACEAIAERSGTCIDSNNYRASQDGDETVQSNGTIDAAAREHMGSLRTRSSEERFGAFDQKADGSVAFTEVDGSSDRVGDVIQGKIQIKTGTDAIGHSHPEKGDGSVVPGPSDGGAIEAGQPSYIIHQSKIIVVEKVDGQYQARVVQGRVDNNERKEIRKRLNEFQRSARP